MSKFTPGPWGVREGDAHDHVFAGSDYVPRRRICGVYGGLGSIEGLANARLIAAAPELLEQLDIAVEIIRSEGFNPSVYETMLAAIDKATRERSVNADRIADEENELLNAEDEDDQSAPRA